MKKKYFLFIFINEILNDSLLKWLNMGFNVGVVMVWVMLEMEFGSVYFMYYVFSDYYLDCFNIDSLFWSFSIEYVNFVGNF